MRTSLLLPLLPLLLLAAQARSEPLPSKDAIESHVRKAHAVPAEVPVRLGALRPAGVPSMQKAELTIGEGDGAQKVEAYFSSDGRHYFLGEPGDLSTDPDAERAARISLKDRPARGSGPVTIVEFSDFQCPFCRKAHQALAKELEAYKGRVRLVFKHFPLTRIHPWAQTAAVAAACARRQDEDAFWKLADGFFEKQPDITEKTVREKAIELASRTRVDLPKFTRCLDKRESLEEVGEDQAEGNAVGVLSTPFFFVNGRPVRGYRDFAPFKALIKEKLDEAED